MPWTSGELNVMVLFTRMYGVLEATDYREVVYCIEL